VVLRGLEPDLPMRTQRYISANATVDTAAALVMARLKSVPGRSARHRGQLLAARRRRAIRRDRAWSFRAGGSGTARRAFLFKTHDGDAVSNQIVGLGFFSG
jgi:hypothetical protein